jgi:hypothetical protein
MVRDANCFHHFEDGTCSLHGLFVMPEVCLVNHYIKLILLVACLLVQLHCHSCKLLSDVVPLKKWPSSIPVVLISFLYHFYHLGLVLLSCYAWSYFGN